jgi:hypothetical protein
MWLPSRQRGKNVSEALEKVDLKAVEALKKLKDEQDVLRKRLGSLDEMKEKVDAKVYSRVGKDYHTRMAELEAEAKPLREQVRAEFAKLKGILDELEAQHETVRLDREEVELRHTLGEFDDKEYQRRLGELDASIKTGASSKKRADELKKRFLGAVDSEDDLSGEPTAPPPPTPAPEQGAPQVAAVPAGAVAATQEMPVLDPEEAAGAKAAKPEETPRGPTPPPKAPAFNPDATITIRSARLVPQNAEAGRNPMPLGLKPSSIGSDESNDIRIGGDAVDAKHAKVTISMSGYTLIDLGSKSGTLVNGDKIKDRVLRDGDAVQIGAARFVFREA